MPCTIIPTPDPLILNLDITPDDDENGDINQDTLEAIKRHVQRTLLSRHYKRFIWNLPGITQLHFSLIAKILMGFEKSSNAKCEFFLFNVSDELFLQFRILKLTKIIKIIKVNETPNIENYNKFFIQETEGKTDDSFLLKFQYNDQNPKKTKPKSEPISVAQNNATNNQNKVDVKPTPPQDLILQNEKSGDLPSIEKEETPLTQESLVSQTPQSSAIKEGSVYGDDADSELIADIESTLVKDNNLDDSFFGDTDKTNEHIDISDIHIENLIEDEVH
jgi:anti-anti-sigma regulatory factor